MQNSINPEIKTAPELLFLMGAVGIRKALRNRRLGGIQNSNSDSKGDRVWGLGMGMEGKVEFSITFGCRMEHSV